jgi:hypothetical protein
MTKMILQVHRNFFDHISTNASFFNAVYIFINIIKKHLFSGKKRKHFQTTIKTEWESPSLFQHTYKNSTCDGKISLQIIKQPERQHRARYQTEGSRGAIKDRSQNMFPSVQLKGYAGLNGMMGSYPPTKPPILQVFIGNDQGDPIPHIYYQVTI